MALSFKASSKSIPACVISGVNRKRLLGLRDRIVHFTLFHQGITRIAIREVYFGSGTLGEGRPRTADPKQ
jgi:hypothetical protein